VDSAHHLQQIQTLAEVNGLSLSQILPQHVLPAAEPVRNIGNAAVSGVASPVVDVDATAPEEEACVTAAAAANGTVDEEKEIEVLRQRARHHVAEVRRGCLLAG